MQMRWTILTAAVLCIGLLDIGANAVFAAGGEAFTDAAQAGPDFALQGEYKGSLKLDGKESKIGAQVIALGDGAFEAVMLTGGLPGDGWARGDKKEKVQGKTEGASTNFRGPNWSARLSGETMSFSDSGGNPLGELKKVERKSPTLGEKPPQNALVLFDGASVDHFPNAKMTDDHLLLAGALGKDDLQDFRLHIEFRTPFMAKARGQGRGNSGVYLQNRYEVQVLDSFGLDGANNECGGLYSVREPAVNMCLPPLAWQTYDIDFTAARFDGDTKSKNARMTIKHNGVVIYDDFEMPKLTPGGAKSEAPGVGPLQLQNHGNPVAFRNIWVVEKK